MELTSIRIIVQKLMTYYGLNQLEFARKFNCDTTAVSRWLNGKQTPQGETYLRLLLEYEKIKNEEPPILKIVN